MIADANEKDVPFPSSRQPLFTHYRSRRGESFAEKMPAAQCNTFV
jgi:hypothetical protein